MYIVPCVHPKSVHKLHKNSLLFFVHVICFYLDSPDFSIVKSASNSSRLNFFLLKKQLGTAHEEHPYAQK